MKIKHDGLELTTDDQCTLTNRVFPGWHGDASDGEKYLAEWSTSAEDEKGNKYNVIYQFLLIKGSEPEDDMLDWCDDDNIYKIEKI